jgi:hypothetical protein
MIREGRSLNPRGERVYHHKYTVGEELLFVLLVLTAAVSLRGAGRCMEVMREWFGGKLGRPSWFSGRKWLLRIGYYKLMRAKEKGEDWVWIVDHTVQEGAEKCLFILGIRLSALEKEDYRLSHEEVEPLGLFPVKKLEGKAVYEQLEEAVKKTGVPRELLGDHGSDLRLGVEKFCQHHPTTSYIYDIKHKTAGVVKQRLEKDKRWEEFTRLAGQSKQKLQQTELAYLSSSNQRTKARYMNVEILIEWGEKELKFIDNLEGGGIRRSRPGQSGREVRMDKGVS